MALVTGSAWSAPAAHAFSHSWSCPGAYAANQCYDYEGQQYVDWAQVTTSISSSAYQVCAKSITAANNVRSNTCSYNTTIDITCYTYDLPESWAYAYWAGSSGTRTINARADQAYCD
ncbi:MAG TPA: hypothetical protein VFT50_06005 [Baekduia sp.]|nr:hypothetical protein [Baekduia sp.]